MRHLVQVGLTSARTRSCWRKLVRTLEWTDSREPMRLQTAIVDDIGVLAGGEDAAEGLYRLSVHPPAWTS
jgi:hypothetical protein